MRNDFPTPKINLTNSMSNDSRLLSGIVFIEDVSGMDSSFLLFEGDALGRRDDLSCILQRSQQDI
jgi:hypothetical protein